MMMNGTSRIVAAVVIMVIVTTADAAPLEVLSIARNAVSTNCP
jgi:hypothetical protein